METTPAPAEVIQPTVIPQQKGNGAVTGAPDEAIAARPEPQSYSLEELDKTEIKLPEYVSQHIFPVGRVIGFVGRTGAGKTPCEYQMAGDVVSGRAVLDCFPFCAERPVRVAYFDGEHTVADIKYRLHLQEQVRPISNRQNLIVFDQEKILKDKVSVRPEGFKRLHEILEGLEIDLVFLDNLWSLSGGQNINEGHVLQQILDNARRLTMLPRHPTIVVSHHPRKRDKNKSNNTHITDDDFGLWLEEASGSQVFNNLTDVRCGIETVGDHTVFRMRTRIPGKRQEFGPLYLLIDEEHQIATLDNSVDLIERASSKIRRVCRTAKVFMGKPFSIGELKLQMIPETVSERTIIRGIHYLRDHGLLHKHQEDGKWIWA